MNNEKNFLGIFKNSKPIIGMIHLFGRDSNEKLKLAKKEIDILTTNGIDAVLIENYALGSKISDVENVLSYLDNKKEGGIIYGINILGNYHKAFELADRYNASFIQIDSVSGHLRQDDDYYFHVDINKLRENSDAFILGGVRFKYQPVLSNRTVEEDLQIGMKRCDAIVVTGEDTGKETELDKIKYFREVINFSNPETPTIVGAGLNIDNCIEQLSIADAAIVGSWLKEGHVDYGNVSISNTKKLMGRVKTLRRDYY